MFARIRAAFRALVGSQVGAPARPACPICAGLREQIRLTSQQVDYWRNREERTADALLFSKGVQGRVASPASPKADNGMALLARGIGVTEFDSTKSKQPGQGALTSGDREH